MRVRIEPPINEWRFPGGAGNAAGDSEGNSGGKSGGPLIATGHQAWLWHPGILAKDIAMGVAAEATGARTLHLVVDHDVHDTMHVALPIVEGGSGGGGTSGGERLRVEMLRLGDVDLAVPTGCQPPVDRDQLRRRLDTAAKRDDVAVSLDALREAAAALSDAPRSLAEQVGELTQRLMQPYCAPGSDTPLAYSGRLLQQIDGQAIVERMLREPRRCVRAYNAAVAATPEAGVAPLVEEPDRVELPLWQLAWQRPRRRVFADLADATTILTHEDGTAIDDAHRWLAPKALLLTAVMRSALCDRFIHGTGGGLYDLVMERWWHAWLGETPAAPMTVVTADLYLDFDVPVADRADLARAVWYRHHLPHNLDRLQTCATCDGSLAARKRSILAHMDDDRDRRRRRAAFKELHRINRALAAQHADALRDAERAVARAETGLRNAAIARKRDWCFALYSPERLHALRRAIEAQLHSPSTRSPDPAPEPAPGPRFRGA